MYPEAGGSSSFARRAFNEFWSFVAAWAQMLTYVATIAISAFFVPHYLGGLFWDALRHSPGDIIFGCVVIAVLAAINVFGAKESTGVNILLAVIDFATQLLLVLAGIFLVFSPADAGRQRAPRRGARVDGLHPRDPDRHARLHGHRDDLEHVGGGQGRGQDDPDGDQPRAHRRVRDLLHAPGRRAVRAAGDRRAPTASTHAARPARGAGRLRGRPDPRRRQDDGPRPVPERRARSTSACSPRRSCSWPPTRASSASRGSSTRWASTARCPTRCGGCTRASARRGSASSSSRRSRSSWSCRARRSSSARSTRSARCSRSRWRTPSVFRLRIKLPDFPRALPRARQRRRSAATTSRCSRVVGGTFTAIAFVVIVALNLGRGGRRRRLAAIGIAIYVAFRRRQGLDLVSPRTRSRSRSRSSTTRRSTTRCSSRSSTATTTSG